MTQPREPQGNQPITRQQKERLIDVYQRTGNMSLAMREAGIHSPKTAYLWWHRYSEGGEAALQSRSHARHTQQRISDDDDLVERISRMRQDMGWGRRQIASELAQQYGRQISPASVEAVLRGASLWMPRDRQETPAPECPAIPEWLAKKDFGRLMATVQQGIRLSIQSDARGAAKVLSQQVWRPLDADPALRNRLLTTPKLGSWLLSSRLHLGHSLLNSGRWAEAEHYLRETIAWTAEHSIEPRQRAWEEEPHFVTLRRDDVWLGSYHHLGLAIAKRNVDEGLDHLRSARSALHRAHHPLAPGDRAAALCGLERDLAQLKLRSRRHVSLEEIREHLSNAQQSAEEAGSASEQTFNHIAWARLHDRLAREAGERDRGARREQRRRIEQAIERAIQLVEEEREDRPMRQTLCFVGAAQLAAAQGMPVNAQQVQRAARYCLDFGYGGQAKHLLAIPSIQTSLSDETRQALACLL